ncbi:MAG: radical SAM protein [Candidatus Magnetobacterium sp. LHC-1]|uniref:Radical SAM protein n=1 Tax=Candidatus Magnetobacterium casense TaxID=1455061 RepID=A0ABS6S0H7_9BACT|nr:radical SAM protein [Candidatus Magnetobacterium casensis]MBF0609316.1 radical SAM protein [Nitrospirota bacterium]MBV6342365.1 radical SAM protein [Candidatus Magnetobacterium casensis]
MGIIKNGKELLKRFVDGVGREKKAPAFAHKNRQRLLKHIQNKDVILDSGPCRVELSVTTYCNLDCIMCAGPQRTMSLDRSYDWFLEQLGGFIDTLEDVSIIGLGEPLLWKDFDRAVADLTVRGASLRTTTNALLLHKHMDAFKTGNFRSICISIDGTKEVYEYVRKNAKWQQFETNVRALAQLIQGLKKRPVLYFNVAVGTYNYADIPNIVTFAQEIGVDLVSLNRVSFGRIVDEDPTADLLFSDRYEDFRAMMKNLAYVSRVAVACGFDPSLSIYPTWGSITTPQFEQLLPYHTIAVDEDAVQCIYPFTSVQYWSGDVFTPCCLLTRGYDPDEASFASYWNGKYIQNLRKRAYEHTLIPGPCGKDACVFARKFTKP